MRLDDHCYHCAAVAVACHNVCVFGCCRFQQFTPSYNHSRELSVLVDGKIVGITALEWLSVTGSKHPYTFHSLVTAP